ncbi:MAG: hypothetical protein KKD35_02815, partial [Elusimicrobia bacterium]|nr:hypothetical protein [Elusimicrobiota bacterium]
KKQSVKSVSSEAKNFVKLSRIMFGFIDTSILWGAVEAGLYDYLQKTPGLTSYELASGLKLKKDRLIRFLRLLSLKKLILKKGAKYYNPDFISMFLTEKSISENKNMKMYFAHWIRKMQEYGSKMHLVLKGEISSTHSWPPQDIKHSQAFGKNDASN